MKKVFKLKKFTSFPLKLDLKMKLTTLFLIVSLFQLQANESYSQKTKVTLDLEKVSIENVLNQIESLTEFKFFFNYNEFDYEKKVTIHADKERISSILKRLFNDSNISFKVIDKQIILSNKKIVKNSQEKGTTIFRLQEFIVSGTITDSNNQPLPGANILEKGTTNGVQSDFDGKFSLTIKNKNAVLVVSYLGFIPIETSVNDKTTLTIKLQEDAAKLNEVVVTGYASERKSDLTGAVAIVNMDEVVNQPVSSVDNMLTGKVSGVSVVTSGSPGGASSLRIRGFSTIRNNDPLYVIDGVPTTTGINLINPNDIASLQVLKDASSSSIYGSRAANGVVIITTKKGKTEDVKVSLNVYSGVQNVSTLPSNLGAQEYGNVYWDAFNNDGITPNHSIYGNGSTPVIPSFLDSANTIPSSNTDWVKEIFNPAIVQSYNLSISKGGEKSHSLFSLSYFDQKGTLKHTGFNRFTARLNSDYKILNDKVIIGENITIARSGTVQAGTNSILGNPVYNAYRIPSIAPVYDTNGNLTGYPLSDVQNPLGQLARNTNNKGTNIRIFGNVFTEIALLKELKFKTNVGINYTTSSGSIFNPTYTEPNVSRELNNLTKNNQVKYDWVWSNTLNYSKTFNEKHAFNVLLGVESVENTFESTTASISGFPTNETNIQVLNAGDKGTQTNAGYSVESSLFSYFGKLNYSFDNKYLFSATVRKDGTSKLLDNKWGTFPALSVGWKISEEDFFNKEGLVSNLKLRAGWGKTGNQDIPAYQTVGGYSSNSFYSNYAVDGSSK